MPTPMVSHCDSEECTGAIFGRRVADLERVLRVKEEGGPPSSQPSGPEKK